jgi:serine/threonine protein kinase
MSVTPPDDALEAVVESFLARFRSGERPSFEEYAARYPELAHQVRDVLHALAMVEQDLSLGGQTGATSDNGASTAGVMPRHLGDYLILREIGRGGMGVVYEAVQQSLGRHVALKVLPWSSVGSVAHVERFRLEARAAARLHHTNIVPVFGVGEQEGTHYFAMQYIRGQSLDVIVEKLRRLRQERNPGGAADPEGRTRGVAEELLAPGFAHATAPSPGRPTDEPPDEQSSARSNQRISSLGPERAPAAPSLLSAHSDMTPSEANDFRGAARVALQVAEALAYAHEQGIIHRDIKPSNIMIDVHGTVWVTDFGLSKVEGSDGPTQTGDIPGTLRYMAPERFEGHSDARSDLYGLGATLYELLTLRPLFDEASRPKLGVTDD